MKKSLVVLALAGCLSTSAIAGPELWAPSPLTVILQVGKWMWQEREEVYYVRVRAVGKNEQDAREQAFRLAVDQAVGSLLLSDIRVRDGEVKRNDIINYSSGFIHGFKILDRQRVSQGFQIDLDVWVRKSGIADRLLADSQATDQIDGGQIAESFNSLKREREQGDRALASVLEDFPKKSFDIKFDNIRSWMDGDRRLRLQVDYTVSWNAKYVKSLADAMTAVAQDREAQGCYRAPYRCEYATVAMIRFLPEGNSFFRDVRYLGFRDRQRTNLLRAGTTAKNPLIRVTLHDGHGGIGYRGCFAMNELSETNYSPERSFVRVYDERMIVDGDLAVATRSEFVVDPELVKNTRQVDLRAVSQDECRQ